MIFSDGCNKCTLSGICTKLVCTKHDQSPETNIKTIKQILPDKSEVTAKGYLIFKTKSCSFRTTDPPYPPGAPCAPNSGYVILSDVNVNKDWNPTSQKTTLTNDQILVYSTPDKIIDELSLKQVYQIQGSGKKYNGIEALKFNKLLE